MYVPSYSDKRKKECLTNSGTFIKHKIHITLSPINIPYTIGMLLPSMILPLIPMYQSFLFRNKNKSAVSKIT